MNLIIAKRYAQAFFDLARENNNIEAVYEDLNSLHIVCDQSTEFNAFLNDPIISAHDKQEIIKDLFNEKINPLTLTLLLFLAEKVRLDLLRLVCVVFEQIYYSSHNILQATIESKVELSKTQLDNICDKFKKLTRKNIEANTRINPDMFGGFKVQIKDTIYDFTIESKLKKFKQSIINH